LHAARLPLLAPQFMSLFRQPPPPGFHLSRSSFRSPLSVICRLCFPAFSQFLFFVMKFIFILWFSRHMTSFLRIFSLLGILWVIGAIPCALCALAFFIRFSPYPPDPGDPPPPHFRLNYVCEPLPFSLLNTVWTKPCSVASSFSSPFLGHLDFFSLLDRFCLALSLEAPT